MQRKTMIYRSSGLVKITVNSQFGACPVSPSHVRRDHTPRRSDSRPFADGLGTAVLFKNYMGAILSDNNNERKLIQTIQSVHNMVP